MPATHQLELSLVPHWARCAHEDCFITHACVPAGLVCSDCDTLLLQYVPEPPEKLGYLSADWAWHHVKGRPWTTLP